MAPAVGSHPDFRAQIRLRLPYQRSLNAVELTEAKRGGFPHSKSQVGTEHVNLPSTSLSTVPRGPFSPLEFEV
jgi:hypothetical protein